MTRFNDQPWTDANITEPNFMTPEIVERGRKGNWAWEVSEGEGMEHEAIFGTTFLKWDGETWARCFDVDKLVWSKVDAYAHVREVCER